ncbi:uncharacterized protein YndB with AHSA1/START domain [Caulobacter ginsengisoli]|uniref:Uncharacterized protein YndB with AHSA1/START domain n=1 Tax=Caulobacter ginsengisoli TaxID=400775 RepID=A0ABU0IM02_9CAUL|nr:SRPBCC domain-containing protein [Caulobacter ginsengisoli]MDQ0462406.1 uncharacterized protein YndB with AHSA1/START domain [Caulobacter ginsengisoli]
MIRAALVLAVALALGSPALAAPSAVKDTSFVDQTGARLLQQRVVIAAPPAAVWRALTDQAAYRQWVAPNSFIDLRVGGSIEVALSAAGKPGDPSNIKQEILGYVPQRLMVFRNLSVPPVPGGAVYPKLAIVLELNPAGEGTEVVLSQVGYGAGADFDALYGFFKQHNPEFLLNLKAFAERS